MRYDYTLTTTIPAAAQEIYDAWLDSLTHSEMTGAEARMSDEVGADVAAWDGYISGRNLELVPGERIVQSWRTTEFTDEHPDSIITVTLEEADDGTLLTLEHINVPADQTSYEHGGWQEHYFEPMKQYFAKHGGAGRKAKAAAPKKRAVAKSKSKAKAKVKAKSTAAGAKSKVAKSKVAKTRAKASKAKTAKAKVRSKKKAKRAAAKAKTAKKAKRKSKSRR